MSGTSDGAEPKEGRVHPKRPRARKKGSSASLWRVYSKGSYIPFLR